VRGSVRAYPVRSAPNVCINCAARARETLNSRSMSRRVSSSRSRSSSCRMASGMASSHCGLAGTGRAFRLHLLLRVRVSEEVGHARFSLHVSRRSYRMQAARRGRRAAHKGRYGIDRDAKRTSARIPAPGRKTAAGTRRPEEPTVRTEQTERGGTTLPPRPAPFRHPHSWPGFGSDSSSLEHRSRQPRGAVAVA